jgi:DNA-binding MarR family transcriptional regulator
LSDESIGFYIAEGLFAAKAKYYATLRNEPIAVEQVEFETLAAFRNSLRRFLKYSEASAGAAGVSPQAYQALLAIRGQSVNGQMSVGDLAEILLVKHNSAVGLVDRLSAQGFVKRKLDGNDKRRVFLVLTEKGEALVSQIAARNKAKLVDMRGDLKFLLDRLQEL